MSEMAILGQDEIDALMNGIDSGEVPTEAPPARDEARPHDFTRYGRIVRGRMPTLEMINDRFGRLLRGSLYNELRRAAVISVGSVQIVKFADYVRTLHLPTSLNLVKFNPLRGTGLIILDPTLVFALIDIYFGGKGRHAKIEGREFTAIENEIIANVLKETFRNLQEAWSHIAPLVIEKVGSEMNPHFANIVSPTEIVVVARFGVDFDGVGGDLHVTMPYSMIEPLREVLDSGVQSDRVDQDDRWSLALRHELEDAELEVRAVLGTTTLSLSELRALQAGDVIATDFTGAITLMAEGLPVLRGQYGLSRGQCAVKVTERIQRSLVSGLDDVTDGRGALKGARTSPNQATESK
jgi:flagellar motor switch protein FliM